MTMTTRTYSDVKRYEQKALDQLDLNHPHYEEILTLLKSQIQEDLTDCYVSNTITNR